MNPRVIELIDYTKTKFGLENYYLHTHKFYRNLTIFNDTVYTLCMEWFPNHINEQQVDEAYNPEGTAVIEVNVNSCKFERVIFVGGKSYANGVTFSNLDTKNIIKWLESETGLKYGEQFQKQKEEEGELLFKECIYGVGVSPSGYIELKFNAEGKLTFFSVSGPFVAEEIVKKENYSLSIEKIEDLAKEQLKLLEFPSDKEQRLIPVYGIEEIYVNNHQTQTIPFEFIVDVRSHLAIDKVIYWDTPINTPFEGKEISLVEDVTTEQAFSCEPHPNSFPITKLEQEKCIVAVEDFLRQVFSSDTGKWILKTLHRDKGYILATLRENKQDKRVFQRKLLIMIDTKSIQPMNYMDNKSLLDIFEHFQAPEEITITKEEAYEKIRGLIELKPVYVYDFKQNQYVLCGKLDCNYYVNACHGEIISSNDLH